MTHKRILQYLCASILGMLAFDSSAKQITKTYAATKNVKGTVSANYLPGDMDLLTRGTVSNTYNLLTYSLTFPDFVCVGQQFPITVRIQNPTGINVAAVVPFADIVPDPTQGPAFTPGLSFISNTPPTQGTFDPTAATLMSQGGKGAWFSLGTVNANTTLTVTETIMANAVGTQTYTAWIQGNPPVPLPPVIINVVSAPTANNLNFNACFNTPVSGTLTASGGSGSYTFAVVGGSQVGGTVTSFNSSTGAFTFTPTTGFSGVGGFHFTVTDANTGCTGATQGVVTIAVNPALVATPATFATCVNGSVSSTVAGHVSGGTPPYTFAQVGTAVNGFALVNADGTFIFVPTAGFGGTASFQFQATDSIGCTSNVATATINVGPLANPQTVSTCENTPLSGTLTTDVSGGVAPLIFNQVGSAVNGVAVVNANGTYTFTPTTNFIGTGSFQYQVTDANACTSTATITVNILQCCVGFVASPATFTTCQNTPFNGTLVGLVTGGTPPYTYSAVGTAVGGTVVVNPAGTFTFTPTTGFTGNASFQYMAVDSTGCSATATITIVVEAVTANPTTLNTCINTPINGSLVSLVSGGTAPYTFTQVGAGVNGVAVVNANGTFTFTPTTGFTGTASFQYRATDVNGCSGTATVTINVRQVTVTATSFNSCLNTPTSGNLTGLVTGGTPPYTFAQVGTAVNGVAVVNANGTFTFTPTTGFAGAGSFQYHVTDSVGCVSNTATVTINVGPLANSETITACFDTTLTGSLVPYVTGGIAPLTFAQVGTAVNGVAVVSANGAFTFTPTASFTGTGSFGYRVTDANACTSTGTITITVGQCCTPSNKPYIQYYDSLYPPSPI